MFIGTEKLAVPVAGLAVIFSPIPWIAPPEFGSSSLGTREGSSIPLLSFDPCSVFWSVLMSFAFAD